MKSLIVTVAGTATRFNKDTAEETLKCLYHIADPKNSLLYQILSKARDFDEFIIVGGFLYDKLQTFVIENLSEFAPKIKLVYNSEYRTYGSGYSLILGIEAVASNSEEVIFVEGDLFFSSSDFDQVKNSHKNVFTVNRELIAANKAVVVYEDAGGRLRYLYDTAHRFLRIDEDFQAVYNSGQIWKFVDVGRLRSVVASLTTKQIRGTNLEIIQGYFGPLGREDREMVSLETWYNCNTVEDYKKVYSIIVS